jgi:hypothetical protein
MFNRVAIIAIVSWAVFLNGLLAQDKPIELKGGQPEARPDIPKVSAPPDAVIDKYRKDDRDSARRFYGKYLDANGLSVLASGEVADEALVRTRDIVSHVLAGRPDVLDAMTKAGTRLIIIGKDQVYTDMPEYRNSANPAYMNERVRGTGSLAVTSFGEENLLNLAGDRYDDESIAVHEFLHTVDAALARIDVGWRSRLSQTYKNALAKGLWKKTYAASNAAEYWAEIGQSYFDCNRVNNWNHGPIGTREQLKQYDPDGYELVRTTLNLKPETDWRYTPLRLQPSVITPPARLKVPPYYTKVTFAREFPVLGSNRVSDRALLKANDTIRKMFAYRHDILKAMIADGARLVVLAPGERLSDLPEFADGNKSGPDLVRHLDYTPSLKLMAAPEENVLALPGDPFAGQYLLVHMFAKGLYRIAGLRPMDADFEKRRERQQYEIGVKRLDVDFDKKVAGLFDSAIEKKLWGGTTAARDRFEYWAAGVEAYFDASGRGVAPGGAERPITTRELLKTYDPALYSLVDETMAFRERIDWRANR